MKAYSYAHVLLQDFFSVSINNSYQISALYYRMRDNPHRQW